MKEYFTPNTEEKPAIIILGIIIFYLLVGCFIAYLYLLHRISLHACIIAIIIFSCIYIPRFLIIYKLNTKDKIKLTDSSILINEKEIPFENILDYKVEEKKPQVVFFMNNSRVIFQEAKFQIATTGATVMFGAIGTEKIRLLKEFLNALKS